MHLFLWILFVYLFVFGHALTWDVLLPHLSPERAIVALFLVLIRTRCLMHTKEREWQSHSSVALHHIGAVVADSVHGQCARRLIHWL